MLRIIIIGLIFVIFVYIFITSWITFIVDKSRIYKRRKSEVKWIDENYKEVLKISRVEQSYLENELFEPTEHFYKTLVWDNTGLYRSIDLLCRFINYRGPKLSVTFTDDKIGAPAIITDRKILIQSKFRHKKYELGAILAHLISSSSVYNCCTVPSAYRDTGYFIDLTSIALGFGKLVLNGYNQEITEIRNISGEWKQLSTAYFGYFEYHSLIYAFELDRIRRNIATSKAMRNLRYQLGTSFAWQHLIIKYRRVFTNNSKRENKNRKEPRDKEYRYEKGRKEKEFLQCTNCGPRIHVLKAEYLGNERWMCSVCGNIKTIERL